MKMTGNKRSTQSDDRPQLSLGSLVHGVVNSTASISFSASALRTGGKLTGADLDALARIEQAAALVAETVKRFASTPPPAVAAPAAGSTVDLYEICCEIAQQRRRRGRVILCRAFGDSRGQWQPAKLIELTELMIDSATKHLGSGCRLTLMTSGFGRHVRLSVHGLGSVTPEAKKAFMQLAAQVDPSLGGLMTVTVGRAPGTVLSMHLPRHGGGERPRAG